MTQYDAIIVGAGAVGTWVSKRLTEGGLRVALVEAGRRLDPDEDFSPATIPLDEAPGRHVQTRAGGCSGIRRRFFVIDDEHPYTTPEDKPFIWSRGRQVGGRLHVWSRHAPRASDDDLRPWQPNDIRSWPVSYEELASHYDAVERRLGVVGRAERIPSVPDGVFLSPPPMSALEEEVCERLRAMQPPFAVTQARTVAHNPARTPLPLADAIETGRLDLTADTVVRRVEVDDRASRATGVEALDRQTRTAVRIGARFVLLCASALETVRLLLNSLESGAHGPIGHYVFDHVFVATGGLLSATQRERASKATTSDPWDFGSNGLYLPGIGMANGDGSLDGRYGIQLGFNARLGAWGAAALGEMWPRVENRVVLNRGARDAWDVPRLHIECDHAPTDRRMAAHMVGTLSAIAAAAGLQEIDPRQVAAGIVGPGLRLPGMASHEAGGARMGRSRDDSVVTADNHCWNYHNLYVVDAACFPSLPFQNPTLTAMAVADRACDRILRESR